MVLTLLHAPGDRPEEVAQALATDADVVIVDLAEAAGPGGKEEARAATVALLTTPNPRVQVRVNDLRTPHGQADVLALAGLLRGSGGVRIPRIESAEQVRAVAQAIPGVPLHPLIASALGVERAFEIATASGAVATISLDEEELRAELGVTDDAGLTWARSRVVIAARAAGLPAPAQAAYPDVGDLDGLAASCRQGRALGFRGRAAVDAVQLPVIVAEYRPTEAEIIAAKEIVTAADQGAAALGRVPGAAAVRHAREVLRLAR